MVGEDIYKEIFIRRTLDYYMTDNVIAGLLKRENFVYWYLPGYVVFKYENLKTGGLVFNRRIDLDDACFENRIKYGQSLPEEFFFLLNENI